LTSLERRFVDVVARVSPAVVQIESGDGLGSGVVFDARGDVVTNHHVVGSNREFTVTLASGHQETATLVGGYAQEDLAVIRLAGERPAPAAFADSAKLAVGQLAFAIGNPLGLRSSVTQGIVSSLGRTVPEGNGAVISSAIQTSAPINPGNSGGALVDMNGNLIGMNSAIATLGDSSVDEAGSIGLGFAIPVDQAKRIADQLITSGKATHASLGVKVGDDAATDGARIMGLTGGGPAAAAGLPDGAVVTKLDDRVIDSADALVAAVRSKSPGDLVTLTYTDPSGGNKTVKVTLGTAPS
jgi:putative serine protease PepD